MQMLQREFPYSATDVGVSVVVEVNPVLTQAADMPQRL